MARTVHIIGAGLAGLAAAVKLAPSPLNIVVNEATAYPGGRCRSYFDRTIGMTIDNGNHLVLSGNHAVREFAKSIGSDGALVGPKSADFIFADLKSPATVRNLRQNSSIEVNVVDQFIRKGYRFKGHAEVLDSGAEFERLVKFYATLGLSDAPKKIQTIVIITVEQVRPLVSPAYDYGADEAMIRAQWTSYYLGD